MSATPGTWYVEKPFGEPGVYVASTHNTALVAKVYNENMDDARLIAATPEMLKALEECIHSYEELRNAQPTGHLWPDPNHIFHARAAVAKAKGQP